MHGFVRCSFVEILLFIKIIFEQFPGRVNNEALNCFRGSMDHYTTSPGRSNTRIHDSKNGIEGATSNILLAAAVSTLPMLGLSAALLGIVFANRVYPMSLSPSSQDEHGFPINIIVNDSSVYYVAFSATSFTAVASWASTIATMLPGFFMALLWYHLASLFGKWSQSGDVAELPTPFQLNLLLAIKGGGFQAMWDWITYSVSRRQSSQSTILRMAGGVLLTATILGYVLRSPLCIYKKKSIWIDCQIGGLQQVLILGFM